MVVNRDITQALIDLILSDVDIAAGFGNRIYGDHLPQTITQTPSAVLWVISTIADDHLLGPLGLERSIVQLDVYGRNRAEAVQWRFAIRDHICGFLGSVSGVTIRELQQASGGRHRTDRPEAGSQQYRFVVSQDYHVAYCSLEAS